MDGRLLRGAKEERVQEPDESLFREYVEARMTGLRRTAYLICGDWHAAEDAVAVALAKLYVHWAKAQAASNMDAYVRRMVVRSVVDEKRRPWRRERPVEYVVPDAPAPTAPIEDRIVLINALAKMPPRRRAVLVLRFFEGLSVEETAAVLAVNVGTVKSQTARALVAMRALLPDEYAYRFGGTDA
jgi:RNA polymerase sigma-70 factor (sigma-E family)